MALLNTQELLKEVGISRATLYRLIEEGLPYHEVGARKKFYDPDEVREFMQKRKDDVQIQLVIGNEYTNKEISSILRVGNLGGMRRSITKNALVLISVPAGIRYPSDDYWKDDILYYTGMGKGGDQDINIGQNKTLAESNKTGIRVYLFEVYKKGKYQYRGLVKLVGDPFLEKAMDECGKIRNVWKFPLRLLTPNYISEDFFKQMQKEKQGYISEMSVSDVIKSARSINQAVSEVTMMSKIFIKNPIIEEYVKYRANGFCELCGKRAPFEVEGAPFLEMHYIIPVKEGGMNNICNVAALCPNCHKKIQYLNDPKDIERILINIEKNEEAIGDKIE